MNQHFTRFAFTDSVKRVQAHYGTRQSYARMEKAGDQYLLTGSGDDFHRVERQFLHGNCGIVIRLVTAGLSCFDDAIEIGAGLGTVYRIAEEPGLAFMKTLS
ncbi:MAG: hypothetical protein L0Z68_04900 [Gammaproteobacteria bacterium]|nr:hypothetical protein [Gammaproteobacteria bacterium]